MDALKFLEEAKQALNSENYPKLKSLILNHAFAPNQKPEDYYDWGRLAEEVGLYQEAIKLDSKACSIVHEHPQALLAMAQIYYQLKDFYQSFKILRKLLTIVSSSEVEKLFLNTAQKLKFYGILKKWKVESSYIKDSFLDTIINYDISPIYEHFMYLFRGIFHFSEISLDTYGNIHLKPELKKLTPSKLREHLLGRTHLVFFPVKDNLKFPFFFLGIKFSEKILQKCLNSESFFIIKEREILNFSLSAYRTLLSLGLKPYLEKIHAFYYRIWFFLEEEISLGQIKLFLHQIKEKLPNLPGGLIFIDGIPQISLLQKFNLQYISLPLGLYLYTLERSHFITEDGIAPEDQLKFFKSIKPMPVSIIKNFNFSFTYKPDFPSEELELKLLRENCHLINYVVQKAEAGKQLSRHEKLAITLTVGFLKNGKNLVHKIFSQTPDYSYTKVENFFKNLPSNPISCFKLELWLKEISAFEPCHCVFGEKVKNRYPCPLLHVNPDLVPRYQETTYRIKNINEFLNFYLRQREKLTYCENIIKNFMKNYNKTFLTIKDFVIKLEDDKLVVKTKN